MKVLKRQYFKSPQEKMVNVNTEFLKNVVSNSGIYLPKISSEMGYCREYLSNCIGVGRMNRDYLEMLSSMLGFSIKQAIEKDKIEIPF